MRSKESSRRRFLTRSGLVLGAAALAPMLPEPIFRRLGGDLWLPTLHANPGVVLNPHDPSNFSKEGGQSITLGNVLTLDDTAVSDFVSFFAMDSNANPGIELDVVATFHVRTFVPVNIDAGNRIAINDGQTRSAIAACIFQNGVRGIGLSQGPATDPSSYPFFVPVDWEAAPVTVRLRRSAAGDAELIEVNGVAPSPRALLTFDKVPGPTRGGIATVEFGCASVEATCTVEYSAFFSERPVHFLPGAVIFTQFRLRDADSADRVRFRGDFTLSSGSNGIDPGVQPVTLRLSTPGAGQFYPPLAADFNPLQGFTPLKRRSTLNDAERTRSGIERFDIDDNRDGTGGVFLRDVRTTLPALDYSTVLVDLFVGDDVLTETVHLREKPRGSGRWRLDD